MKTHVDFCLEVNVSAGILIFLVKVVGQVKSSQFVSNFCFRIIWCLRVSYLLEDLE